MSVVVISGASAGIGAACAVELAKGNQLVLGARRIDRLKEVEASCREAGATDVLIQPLDVRDGASVEAFGAKTLERFGRCDVLLNNSGLAVGVDPVAQGRPEDWQTMLDTNVMGCLRLARRFLPDMIKRGDGHIVNMGSIAGFYTYAGGAVYAATKHALKAISGALRLELNGTMIRVSEIDPGMVETEFSNVRLGDEAKAKAVYKGMQPLTAKDIAEIVKFVVTRPPHVNLDHILVMPTHQAAVYKVHRES